MNAVGDGTVTIDLFDVKAQYTVDGVYHRSTDDASTNSAVFQWTKTKNGKSSVQKSITIIDAASFLVLLLKLHYF